jgi:hypothetical protein
MHKEAESFLGDYYKSANQDENFHPNLLLKKMIAASNLLLEYNAILQSYQNLDKEDNQFSSRLLTRDNEIKQFLLLVKHHLSEGLPPDREKELNKISKRVAELEAGITRLSSVIKELDLDEERDCQIFLDMNSMKPVFKEILSGEYKPNLENLRIELYCFFEIYSFLSLVYSKTKKIPIVTLLRVDNSFAELNLLCGKTIGMLYSKGFRDLDRVHNSKKKTAKQKADRKQEVVEAYHRLTPEERKKLRSKRALFKKIQEKIKNPQSISNIRRYLIEEGKIPNVTFETEK